MLLVASGVMRSPRLSSATLVRMLVKRGAQFVARVLDELLLLFSRPCECREHAVERRRQAARLVAALDADRQVETPGGADIFDRRGEPHQRSSRAAGDDPADGRGGRADDTLSTA